VGNRDKIYEWCSDAGRANQHHSPEIVYKVTVMCDSGQEYSHIADFTPDVYFPWFCVPRKETFHVEHTAIYISTSTLIETYRGLGYNRTSKSSESNLLFQAS
jgi:hypothetical protein